MQCPHLWIRSHKDASPCDVVRILQFGPMIRYEYTWWDARGQLDQRAFGKMFRPYNPNNNRDVSLVGPIEA